MGCPPSLDNWTRKQSILFLYSLELKRWRKANRNWAVTFAPLSTTKSFSNFLACKNIPINLLCILLGRSVWNWVDFRGGSPWGALSSCPIAQWKVQPSHQVTWAWVHGRKSHRDAHYIHSALRRVSQGHSDWASSELEATAHCQAPSQAVNHRGNLRVRDGETMKRNFLGLILMSKWSLVGNPVKSCSPLGVSALQRGPFLHLQC